MLPCNSIEAALRRPYTAPPSPSLLCTVQQQQHVSRWQAKKENSGNIKFYESFTQIATLLPINASPARSKVVATSAPSCHCLAVCTPLPPLTPSATVFCSVSFAIFILLQNVFVSTLLYLFCAHTKKVVCSPFNRPPPPPQPPFLHSLPLPCNGQPFSNAAQHSRCSIVRCGSVAFIEYSLLFVFSTVVFVCVCVRLLVSV